ncbi:MAG: hypothetical protein GX351_08520 [Peptococcaceae bacterium]|jgi:hypothetical protein|nr:hypothetical protein [Peptococcaceae bacterium]
MSYNLDSIIEGLEHLKQNLESDTNYAVYWLSETIDFLNNEDFMMALWSFDNYQKALNAINTSKIQQSSELLREKLAQIMK